MRTIVMLFAVTLLIGCATPAHQPFKVERGEIYQKVRTIGLMPLILAANVDKRDEKIAAFDELFKDKLSAAGFNVVPAKHYLKIYDAMKAAVGDLYDPKTGEPIKEKIETLLEHTRREYGSKHETDAMLYSRIVLIGAPWSGNHATWHGVDEPTTGKKGFWAEFSTAGVHGKIPALSLAVVLKDSQDNVYYENYGGIQLVQWLKGSSFVDVPENQLLTDTERNRRSVAISLDPLVREENVQ